jgi:hypothetical protein
MGALPTPPPGPGVKVTGMETSVPPPGAVGCNVIDPLQGTLPFEQTVFVTDTVKVVGAVSAPVLTLKKVPVVWTVKGPEPETATCTFRFVPFSATGLGVALN